MTTTKRERLDAGLAAALGLALLAPGTGVAQQPQQQKPELEGMILLQDGRRQRGFVQDTSKDGLLFALVEKGPGTGYYWDTQVVAVAFDTANDIMRDARAAFIQGNYEDAAKRFAAIADGYANMAWVPNGFASEARFYHIDALRHLGRYEEIGPLLATPGAQAIQSKLGEFYQSQHSLNKIWADVGTGKWDAVKTAITAKEKPVTGRQELLPLPVFQKMPSHEMVQLAFIRGKMNGAAGEKGKALDDYYRAFTLTYANNRDLALQAMEAAMAIHRENPRIEDEKNKSVLLQMQSMAYLYKNAFGSGEINPDYAAYAVKPELPEPPAVKREDDEEIPPAAEPKKMEPEGGDASAAAGDDPDKSDGKDDKPDEPAAGDDKTEEAKPEPEPKPEPSE